MPGKELTLPCPAEVIAYFSYLLLPCPLFKELKATSMTPAAQNYHKNPAR